MRGPFRMLGLIAVMALAGCQSASEIAFTDSYKKISVDPERLDSGNKQQVLEYTADLKKAYLIEGARIEDYGHFIYAGYLAGALTAAGALVFDAHTDVLAAAGLATGGLAASERYLTPSERTRIFHAAAGELRCILAAGNSSITDESNFETDDLSSNLTSNSTLSAQKVSQAALDLFQIPPGQSVKFSSRLQRNIAILNDREEIEARAIRDAILGVVLRADKLMRREIPDYKELAEKLAASAQQSSEIQADMQAIFGLADIGRKGQQAVTPAELASVVAAAGNAGEAVAKLREQLHACALAPTN